MISKHFIKYYKNYLFILFVSGSYILKTNYKVIGVQLYYIIALVIFILGFTKLTLIKDFGLSFKIFQNTKFYYYLIPSIFISNILLYFISTYYMGEETQTYTSEAFNELIITFLFIGSIRTFGEEFIFRGFLLAKPFKADNFFLAI